MMDGVIHTPERVRKNFNARPTNEYEAAAKRIEWDLVVKQLAEKAKERTINQERPVNIADIGTGPGVSARILKDTFADKSKIIGIDPSDQPIEAIQRKGDDKVLDWAIVHPIENLNKAYGNDLAGQCDIVTIVGVIDFIDPDDLEAAVEEFNALLSKNGVLALTIEPENIKNPGVSSKQHNLETLKGLLNANGITDIEMAPATYKAWGSAAQKGQDRIDTMIVTAIKTERPSSLEL